MTGFRIDQFDALMHVQIVAVDRLRSGLGRPFHTALCAHIQFVQTNRLGHRVIPVVLSNELGPIDQLSQD